MLKLTISYSRKVGEANYGSRGAGVSLECELAPGLLRRPRHLQNKTQRVFALARRWVDAELAGSIPPQDSQGVPAASPGACSPGHLAASGNGHHPPNLVAGSNGSLPITGNQMRVILRLAGEKRIPWDQLLPSGKDLAHFTRREASQLIDYLQTLPVGSRTATTDPAHSSDPEMPITPPKSSPPTLA